jgi:type II secretory pathway pseudopilin PulG
MRHDSCFRRQRRTRGTIGDANAGFSLVEMLIGSAVLIVVLAAIYIILEASQRDYASASARSDVQQNVRVVLESMARELRAAGYRPSKAGCLTPPPGAVTALGASPTSVTFQADVDNNACVDQVVYTFVAPTDATAPCDPSNAASVGKITRSVRAWDGAAWSPATPTAYDIAQCVTSLGMTYYDGSGTVTAVPANIRRINMSITGVENARGSAARTYNLSTDISLRNS